MKYTYKSLLIFSIGATFIFLSKGSFAQPRGMTMNQVYRQLGNQSLNQRIFIPNYNGANGVMPEYDFQVIMRDSSKKEITSAIYNDTITHKDFIVWIDKHFKKSDTNRYKKIYPSQTLSLNYIVIAKDDDNPGSSIQAKITDSCWMFKRINGAINTYTSTGYSDSWNNQAAVVGIQLNDGPILAFTETNLKNMVRENPRALELVSEKKYVKAIKTYNSDMEKAIKK